MPNPCRQHASRPLLRRPVQYGAVALLSTALLFIGLAAASADGSITLDFVRHAQAENNVGGLLDTKPPGEPLTEPLGEQQAQALVNVLGSENIQGIYASQFTEDSQTATPLAEHLDLPVQIFAGLNDIPGGIFNGLGVNDYTALNDLFGALYIFGPLSWTLGLYFVPELGDPSFNGATFEDLFGGSVQAIYDSTTGGNTDAAFAAEASVAIWTLMNVNNPDFSLIFGEALKTGDFLPYTGIAVVQGEPGDWTLVSWDGQPVPPASLPIELFVDVRDLITAPQMAAYNIWEAILTGDPTTIESAIGTGVGEVGKAILNFPIAVITDLLNALQGDLPASIASVGSGLNLDTLLGDLSTDLTNLVPTMATDLAGLLPGELGTMASAALAAF
jgi:Histidine phosphatase superfamily (branch 1)